MVRLRCGTFSALVDLSPRRLRSEHTGRVNRASVDGHLWSLSCLAASRGDAPLRSIRQYTEQQQRPAPPTGTYPALKDGPYVPNAVKPICP